MVSGGVRAPLRILARMSSTWLMTSWGTTLLGLLKPVASSCVVKSCWPDLNWPFCNRWTVMATARSTRLRALVMTAGLR